MGAAQYAVIIAWPSPMWPAGNCWLEADVVLGVGTRLVWLADTLIERPAGRRFIQLNADERDLDNDQIRQSRCRPMPKLGLAALAAELGPLDRGPGRSDAV